MGRMSQDPDCNDKICCECLHFEYCDEWDWMHEQIKISKGVADVV